ncbi:hypothetical protein GCM10025876_12620 [Demequina litorisediminis]|uniref:Peptidyl-prolyl cis-trans isomerase n=1 Tax=Demequina litorisediminis TaxID=1849022 RepID=A0ABQ6IE75_9MICO|nr:hypothetical protein GCM10025876_12620 [Demequina litorisediminis]
MAQTLIKGEGEEVAEGDTVTVNYTGWIWDGDQFDSSWDRGATASFVLSRLVADPGLGRRPVRPDRG